MNLTDYTIHGSGKYRMIDFNQLSLTNLEIVLNSSFKINTDVDYILNKLSNIKTNWTNLSYLHSEYGLWDDGELVEKGVTGHWFYFFGGAEIDSYICVETEKLYLENIQSPQYPVVEVSVNEFINILEQWKLI